MNFGAFCIWWTVSKTTLLDVNCRCQMCRTNGLGRAGIDDAPSECGLDNGVTFDFTICNNGNHVELERDLQRIITEISQLCSKWQDQVTTAAFQYLVIWKRDHFWRIHFVPNTEPKSTLLKMYITFQGFWVNFNYRSLFLLIRACFFCSYLYLLFVYTFCWVNVQTKK